MTKKFLSLFMAILMAACSLVGTASAFAADDYFKQSTSPLTTAVEQKANPFNHGQVYDFKVNVSGATLVSKDNFAYDNISGNTVKYKGGRVMKNVSVLSRKYKYAYFAFDAEFSDYLTHKIPAMRGNSTVTRVMAKRPKYKSNEYIKIDGDISSYQKGKNASTSIVVKGSNSGAIKTLKIKIPQHMHNASNYKVTIANKKFSIKPNGTITAKNFKVAGKTYKKVTITILEQPYRSAVLPSATKNIKIVRLDGKLNEAHGYGLIKKGNTSYFIQIDANN